MLKKIAAGAALAGALAFSAAAPAVLSASSNTDTSSITASELARSHERAQRSGTGPIRWHSSSTSATGPTRCSHTRLPPHRSGTCANHVPELFMPGCRACGAAGGHTADTKRGPSEWKTLFRLVGMTGFEPATSSSRTTRATKLRHIPIRCKSNFTRISDEGPGCEIGVRARLPAAPGRLRPGSLSRRRAAARSVRRRRSAAPGCRPRRCVRRGPPGPGPPSPPWRAGAR